MWREVWGSAPALGIAARRGVLQRGARRYTKGWASPRLMANELEKEAAARASLRFIKDGQIVGIGTGSTAAYFIQLLGEQVKNGLRIRGIPTSDHSGKIAARLGIPLTTLDECPEIDVTVDGAD